MLKIIAELESYPRAYQMMRTMIVSVIFVQLQPQTALDILMITGG